MQPTKKYTLKEATKTLERYCEYQERCLQEVKIKLTNMNMIPDAIDTIMAHLLEHNFLNEERFAKTFVRGKFKIKNWGKRRLTFELTKKDVNEFNINQALAQISNEDYIEVFNNLTEKRANLISEASKYKKRKKFIDYFLYRGWEPYLVFEKANELIK